MSKAKKQKKQHKGQGKSQTIMERSDIPYAQRMALKHQNDIVVNRNHAAKITMFCACVAMHELEGIGYKRLVRFGLHFRDIVNEFYEDTDLGMAHAKSRLEQMGITISGEFYYVNVPGQSKRAQEIDNHRLQASQIALLCNAIAMNDEFGFGQERQIRIDDKINELTGRYRREGEKFLMEKMAEIGFEVVDGEALAYMDDDGKVVTPKQWRKLK